MNVFAMIRFPSGVGYSPFRAGSARSVRQMALACPSFLSQKLVFSPKVLAVEFPPSYEIPRVAMLRGQWAGFHKVSFYLGQLHLNGPDFRSCAVKTC